MQTLSGFIRVLLYLSLAAAIGCGPDAETNPQSALPEQEAPSSSGELLDGVATSLRPEVGLFSNFGSGTCTGTLVDPRFVLTAAHCLGFANTVGPGSSFTMTLAGGSKPVSVDRGFSIGTTGAAPDDLALLRLATPVSAADATPAGISSSNPPGGTTMTIFGFGCQDRRSLAGGGFKQFVSFTAGSHPHELCPGDSGGPVFFFGPTERGKIWGVNSAHNTFTGEDIYAIASNAFPALTAVKDMSSSSVVFNNDLQLASFGFTGGVKTAVGDFNHDGLSDIAFAGAWNTQPVAFSNGDGTFGVTNRDVWSFPAWATDPKAKLVSGDFNDDGFSDLALVGGALWTTIPVALSLGDGTFSVRNVFNPILSGAALVPGTQVVTGDFNADGKTDIAFVGGNGVNGTWTGISQGDGSFAPLFDSNAQFASWATGGAKAVAGDFDGDGDADIALTGSAGWSTIEVALSNRNGTFSAIHSPAPDFGSWAGSAAKIVVGDFNGDSRADIAAIGGPNQNGIAFAFGFIGGIFGFGKLPMDTFPPLAAVAPIAVTGRFNNDNQDDIVYLGMPNVPIAFIQR